MANRFPKWILNMFILFSLAFTILFIIGEFQSGGGSARDGVINMDLGNYPQHFWEMNEQIGIFFMSGYLFLTVLFFTFGYKFLKESKKSIYLIPSSSVLIFFILINFLSTRNYFIYNLDKIILIILSFLIVIVSFLSKK